MCNECKIHEALFFHKNTKKGKRFHVIPPFMRCTTIQSDFARANDLSLLCVLAPSAGHCMTPPSTGPLEAGRPWTGSTRRGCKTPLCAHWRCSESQRETAWLHLSAVGLPWGWVRRTPCQKALKTGPDGRHVQNSPCADVHLDRSDRKILLDEFIAQTGSFKETVI